MNLGQSYEILKSDGEWRFEEELAGRKCSCTLRIVGSWVAHLLRPEANIFNFDSFV